MNKIVEIQKLCATFFSVGQMVACLGFKADLEVRVGPVEFCCAVQSACPRGKHLSKGFEDWTDFCSLKYEVKEPRAV